MKNIFVLFAILTPGMFCFSQVHKGCLLIGGSIGFQNNKSKTENSPFTYESKTKAYVLIPSVGLAIRENSILGIGATYINYEEKTESSRNTNNTYGGMIYYRRFRDLGKNFLLYGEASGGYQKSEEKYYSNQTNTEKKTQQSGSVYLGAGMAYLAGKHFMLEAGLNQIVGFAYTVTKDRSTLNPQMFINQKVWSVSGAVSGGSPLTLGFRFLLGNK